MKHALVSAAAIACLLLGAQLAPALPHPAPLPAPAPAAASPFAAADFAPPAHGLVATCPAVAPAAESPLPVLSVCGRLQCTPCIQQHLRCVASGGGCFCEK